MLFGYIGDRLVVADSKRRAPAAVIAVPTMPGMSRSPAAGNRNVVLAASGTTTSFVGDSIRIVRGGRVWTVPLLALRSVDFAPTGEVRLHIGGEPRTAKHGLGPTVLLPTPNRRVALVFVAEVRAFLATHDAVPDGQALIRVENRRGRPRMDSNTAMVVKLIAALAVYLPLLTIVAWLPRENSDDVLRTVLLGGWAGGFGAYALWRVVMWRIRSMLILRGRGIGVTGEIGGTTRFGSGAHIWMFPRLDFTTVDGRTMRGVTSVASANDWSARNGLGERITVVYDPENPELASGPFTIGYLLRTVVFGLSGVVALWIFIALLVHDYTG